MSREPGHLAMASVCVWIEKIAGESRLYIGRLTCCCAVLLWPAGAHYFFHYLSKLKVIFTLAKYLNVRCSSTAIKELHVHT